MKTLPSLAVGNKVLDCKHPAKCNRIIPAVTQATLFRYITLLKILGISKLCLSTTVFRLGFPSAINESESSQIHQLNYLAFKSTHLKGINLYSTAKLNYILSLVQLTEQNFRNLFGKNFLKLLYKG